MAVLAVASRSFLPRVGKFGKLYAPMPRVVVGAVCQVNWEVNVVFGNVQMQEEVSAKMSVLRKRPSADLNIEQTLSRPSQTTYDF